MVCLDTMGQDRVFTDEEREFALEAVCKFRDYWEQFEEAMLVQDRDSLLKNRQDDLTNFSIEKIQIIKEREEALVEAKISIKAEEEGTEDKE